MRIFAAMICYFSGTGNTRWAARQLAARTGEQLVYIPDAMERGSRIELRDGERLGIVFPVHGWRPPRLVRQFIGQLQVASPHQPYCYAVCTAGDSIGLTMDFLRKDLARKGLRLAAAFSLIMPESYVGLPFMDVDPKERELQKKAKAAADLELFAEHIYNKVETEQLVKGPLPWFFSVPVGAFFVKILVSDKPFRVETERCVQCGTCERVCPVHDIALDGYPKWLHQGNCLTCFSCYHHCPTHAIEFGKRTKRKGQYRFE